MDGRRAWVSVAIAALTAVAVAGAARGQQLNVSTLTAREGLPQQQVLAVYQDTSGYVWTGTYAGLSRWNGQRFQTFDKDDGLSSNIVHAILEDRAGDLWAGTQGGGLCRRRGESFRCLSEREGLPHSDVHDLAVDGGSGLWAATSGGLAHLGAHGLRTFTTREGLPVADSRSVFEDPAGTVWVGTMQGLARRRPGETRFRPVAADVFGERRIHLLLPTPEGLLVGTDAGAFLVTERGTSRLDLPADFDGRTINDGAVTAGGAVWLVTSYGALRGEDGRFSAVTRSNGLPVDTLYSVAIDREGNVWLGNNSGLSKLVPGPFLTYTTADGLPHPFARALATDDRGRLWVGTRGGGIALREKDTFRPLGIGDGPSDVLSLAPLPGGRMLVGSVASLALMDDGGALRTYTSRDGLPGERVAALFADGKAAWIGTTGGLARWEEGEIRPVPVPGISESGVTALALGHHGELWAGQWSGGIVILDGPEVRWLGLAEGLTEQTIWSLAAHPDGSMWAASNGDGAFRVLGDRIEHFTTEDGLVDDNVWQVLCDRRGDVWLFTNRGLDRYDGEKFVHYGVGDGLSDLEGSAGASWEDDAGVLWFGTGTGLLRFLPEEERPNTVPPPVLIETVTNGDGEVLSPGDRVPAAAGLLSFRFAALSFRNEDEVKYRYRLLGLDERWTGLTRDADVSYASLPPGDYTFEVTGSNDDGVFAPGPARFPFAVAPAYWQTWWFRGAVAALAVLLLTAAPLARARRLEAVRRRLEGAVAQRTLELRRANQRLEELATTDELTGLANRRQFQQVLATQLATLSRSVPPQSLGLVLLDVDHFKRINDRYGHPEGDRLLAELARRLAAGVRGTDLVSRWGGEEFAIVLPATDPVGAAAAARKLHAAVRDEPFELGGRLEHVTASLGVATVDTDGIHVEEAAELLLHEADGALYRAKHQGRDRVVTVGAVVPGEWRAEAV